MVILILPYHYPLLEMSSIPHVGWLLSLRRLEAVAVADAVAVAVAVADALDDGDIADMSGETMRRPSIVSILSTNDARCMDIYLRKADPEIPGMAFVSDLGFWLRTVHGLAHRDRAI
jgi:hypothetical protein